MIYLASPYSHKDALVRHGRYRDACCATAWLLKGKRNVFSPIVHSHPLTEYDLPKGWGFWKWVDEDFISRCDELVVLMLAGWEGSVGVQAEIALAHKMGKLVSYTTMEELVSRISGLLTAGEGE